QRHAHLASIVICCVSPFLSFFFNAPPTTEIYTLSLPDALPISGERLDASDGLALYETSDLLGLGRMADHANARRNGDRVIGHAPDRKSTRLNSSHVAISYAVFCLKKKKIPSTR